MQWFLLVNGCTGRHLGGVFAKDMIQAKRTATRLFGYDSTRFVYPVN